MQRVLVIGASGTTGSRIVQRLHRSVKVRAASRNGGRQLHENTEWARFDWNDPSTYVPVMSDVDAAYLIPPSGVAEPARMLIDWCEKATTAGVKRVVLHGAQSIGPEDGGLGAAYRALPASIAEWAILRPSWFMQNFLGDHPQARSIRLGDIVRTGTGDGRVGFVDADDIAAVAVRALLDEPLQREVVITGPESLAYDDIADVLSRVLGRPIAHDRVSENVLIEQVFGDLPREMAEVLAHMDTRIALGEWDCITDEVEAVTGRPPRSFESFAEAHREQLLSPVSA